MSLQRHGIKQQYDETETNRINRRKMLVPKIIGYYKMNTAKEINMKTGNQGRKFWQPRYHDHIIRNEKELYELRNYIKNNALKWETDRYYKE